MHSGSMHGPELHRFDRPRREQHLDAVWNSPVKTPMKCSSGLRKENIGYLVSREMTFDVVGDSSFVALEVVADRTFRCS